MVKSIEKSIDTNGLWVIDREDDREPIVLYRVWAMPSDNGRFNVYEHPSVKPPQRNYSLVRSNILIDEAQELMISRAKSQF
jgi:hypothetical protein